VASKLGANVTAIDINPNAVACCLENSELNRLNIKVVESNLWSNLPKCSYDFIVVNPPYYPKKAINLSEKAWHCGERFEYFQDFFFGLKSYMSESTTVLMVLSEDCEIDTIHKIANEHQYSLNKIKEKKILWEINLIFKITYVSGEKKYSDLLSK
ncbi:MAG: methyltransferase, partial [Cytophagia bacterium]|nr:methyltransferase [Cytophagia bacterium]